MMSPVKESRGGRPAKGKNNSASSAVAQPTTGPRRKTKPVESLYTEPLRSSLIRVYQRIRSGGPVLPANRALTLRITPGRTGARSRAMPRAREDSMVDLEGVGSRPR